MGPRLRLLLDLRPPPNLPRDAHGLAERAKHCGSGHRSHAAGLRLLVRRRPAHHRVERETEGRTAKSEEF